MSPEEFKRLDSGDIVRGKLSGTVLMVVGNYGEHVTAVLTVDMTHPDEWDLISKARRA